MKNKVYIKPGCITCGLCEFLAPDVFEVTDISRVKSNAPVDRDLPQVKEAEKECPVQVIVCKEMDT